MWDESATRSWIGRWDDVMAGYVPWREDSYALVLEVLERLGATDRVLDLGCGTGSFTRRLLDRRPGCVVTAMDWDPVMLALARVSLRGRASVIEADLASPGWGMGMGMVGAFDAVVTCAVLHMVDASRYGTVVESAAGVLRPGSVFVDVDEMPLHPSSGRLGGVCAGLRQDGADEHFESHEDFRAWMEDLQRDPQVAPLLGLRELRFGSRRDGRVARADERIRALRAAGFTEVDVVERRLDMAVLVAIR